MSTQSSAPAGPYPIELDLAVIHESLLAAGFTQAMVHPDVDMLAAPNFVYSRPAWHANRGFLSLPNPNVGFHDDSPGHDRATQMKVAVVALEALDEITGGHHFECGPRTEREKVLIEALNSMSGQA